MDQTIKMSEVRAKFPMYSDVPDDQLLIALRKKYYSDIPSGRFFSMVDFDTERQRLQQGVLDDMSGTQKVLANIGAGMTDLSTGVRQLYTDMTGTEAEKAAMRQEVEDKRKRDAALAEATPGGELVGKTLQVAGNVVPTLALPVGAATRAVTSLPRTVGMMRAAPTTARLGTGALAADAALTGAALGSIEPLGKDDSRAVNAASGAILSATTPVVLAGGNQVRRMVTQSGGTERAGEQLAQELGDQTVLRQTIDRLRQGRQGPIPLSTAAQLADPQLARLEAGSRARSGANWYDFDQQQARSVYDELTRATRGAENVRSAQRALPIGMCFTTKQ